MKRIRSAVILVTACLICSVLSFHYGFVRALQLQRGTFIVSLDAVQNFRAGDTQEALHKMEAICFGSAEVMYSDPAFRHDNVTTLYAQELKQYLGTYRTNSTQWSATEIQLEKDLANWK